jgi:phosphinothricin acetyltransferase
VETAVYVSERFHRAGVGRALYAELFAELRAQGFMNAYAGITLPNDASVRLHQAVGFRPVGVFERIGFKLGRWHDVGWWQLRLADDDHPAEPMPPDL